MLVRNMSRHVASVCDEFGLEMFSLTARALQPLENLHEKHMAMEGLFITCCMMRNGLPEERSKFRF